MALGMLGEYDSDSNSSISDSDDDGGGESGIIRELSMTGEKETPLTLGCTDEQNKCTSDIEVVGSSSDCIDPLSLGGKEADDSESEEESVDSPHEVAMALPLPNMDRIVARNASYSNSELVTKSSAVVADEHSAKSGDTEPIVESSVFFNPYKIAEDARLAILKQHVPEFDKKPEIKEKASSNVNHRYISHSYNPNTRQRRNSTHVREDEETDLFDESDSSLVKKRKHRSGVGDSLLPPKKFMKMHQKIQAEERPWTLGK